MKKIVIFIFILIIVICLISSRKEVMIPDNSIRIRIVANSNELIDQKNKADIKNEVTSYLYNRLKNVNNYNDANRIIENNIDEVEQIIKNYTSDYKINYGKNHFPKKEYKGVNYKEGDYNSLVINLGESKGKNFWCILFPPLCMIDESKLNSVSYSFYVSELLKKVI